MNEKRLYIYIYIIIFIYILTYIIILIFSIELTKASPCHIVHSEFKA